MNHEYYIKSNNNLYDYDEKYEYLFKIVILGDSGVGKTNLITRYTRNEFNLNLKSTIGVEFCTKSIVVDDKIVKIQFWDTAGQERFRAITSSYYRGTHGIIVVFDITNSNSFDNVENWMQEIYNNVKKNIPILLVGNKSDLEHKRVIPIEKSIELANKYNLQFVEMSALSCKNINSGIQELIKNVYKKNCENKNLNQNNDLEKKNIYNQSNKKTIKLSTNNVKQKQNLKKMLLIKNVVDKKFLFNKKTKNKINI